MNGARARKLRQSANREIRQIMADPIVRANELKGRRFGVIVATVFWWTVGGVGLLAWWAWS